MTITLYMSCNTFICTILFDLSESSEIKVSEIKVKVSDNGFFLHFSKTLVSIISRIKSLNKVISDDYDRPNKMVQMNNLCVEYSVIVI